MVYGDVLKIKANGTLQQLNRMYLNFREPFVKAFKEAASAVKESMPNKDQ